MIIHHQVAQLLNKFVPVTLYNLKNSGRCAYEAPSPRVVTSILNSGVHACEAFYQCFHLVISTMYQFFSYLSLSKQGCKLDLNLLIQFYWNVLLNTDLYTVSTVFFFTVLRTLVGAGKAPWPGLLLFYIAWC